MPHAPHRLLSALSRLSMCQVQFALFVSRRSVVETIKIVTETLEALFDMRLAIPAGVVRCLTEGVDNALQK